MTGLFVGRQRIVILGSGMQTPPPPFTGRESEKAEAENGAIRMGRLHTCAPA